MSSIKNTLNQMKCLFIDCQTTGATPERGKLLEVAWSTGAATDSHIKIQSLIIKQPDGVQIPYRVQNITGITDGELQTAVEDTELFSQLESMLNEDDYDCAVIHYAQFERPFLEELFLRLGKRQFPLPLICTHKIAQRLYPALPTRGIKGLAGYFGADTGELKRSSHHVELTQLIWKSLAQELEAQGVKTYDELKLWIEESTKTKSKQPRVSGPRYQFIISEKQRLALPDEPGVYRMHNKAGKVLYVGKATSLKSRVNSYFRGRKGKDSRKMEMLTQTWDITITVTPTALEAAMLETDEIKRFEPAYNICLKEGIRQLAFHSRDFGLTNAVYNDQHPIGPFSSHLVMDPVQRLSHSIETGVFDPYIFFDVIEPDILRDGFEIFCNSLAIEKQKLATPRALLTVGLYLLREELRAAKRESESTAELATIEGDTEDGITTSDTTITLLESVEDVEENAPSDEAADDEWTADELADKYYRMLVRTARAYLRTKLINRLANSDIRFTEKNKTSTLFIRSTKVRREDASAQPHSWNGLGVDAYDRMSVLAMEISKMKAADRLVSIS